ncbi:hypothetical protein AUEXF2481DRAFT_33485 [Aureobasidium subglaciale EXF-2481]|uniref:Uncharacterized protein n=1 Tax=Aureobasidium subglaciale (strain EXF-2481) TaxID=1043005 RepID=A0A074Y9Y7_AURSE|nr:uncharacterized protein AUEXF2481DRAFT_33485 [Aureobasidium subglaciale EXF-2481]KAI5212867.1 hypothetical protein E4T38_00258 [Aureobasidium subglaciale]KAI5232464.1 hypothetical protein E4T40_00257 [Aureobasidium subglaciale]KAI5234715.1 hypothetical protein E4T41_00257 [Aureobasidium subglaciale]KAI5268392.1 hypothetical protein E4T46_00257 [Aureobasidium subglaciale]KEQ91007.1 hypothetical protein AUEXF2481DRAFT_33485 [Aureobasidium subglaciale EXF-2481]
MGITLNSHHKWHVPHQHAPNFLTLANATLDDGPTLVQRSSESSATSTCKAGDNTGTCQKPTTAGNTTSIIIGVAVAVPVVVAALVLFFLHRRVKRKHAQEDRDDKYKSLDFGLDTVPSKGRAHKGVPEMTITDMEKSTQNMMHTRGLSLDMHTPYLLPAQVNSSSSSLRSMSRSITDGEDPYRPVTMASARSSSIPDRSSSRPKPGNASVYTDYSERSENLNAGLLNNAQRMSRSDPFMDQSPDSIHAPNYPTGPAPVQRSHPAPPPPAHMNNSFAASAAPRTKPVPPKLTMPDPDVFHVTPPSPPEHHYAPAPPAHVTPPSPPPHQQEPAAALHPAEDFVPDGLHAAAPDARRVSVMGLRPLPPDHPDDNPEQRANRIRSFYKEYFDDSKPNPQGQYQNEYEADIYADYSAYMYEAPQVPYAQPMARRAMTPPPRVGGGRVRSNTSFGSTGHIANPAFRRPPQQPRKQLPPPIALHNLPTPSALTDDMTFTPTLFAPPVSYRDRQAGRTPSSPARPYSPSVRAFTPLATSFDDLSVIPSAHALRKSSTFTALDFAPPPRFRNEASGSDAGSIRSNRSGISNVQQNAIRAGAYRVSRLPGDMVGTQSDLNAALKPTWDMSR